MPVPRTRFLWLPAIEGYADRIAFPEHLVGSTSTGLDVCIDSVGNILPGGRYEPGPLWLEHYHRSPVTFSGQAASFPTYRYDKWPTTWQGPYNHVILGTPDPHLDLATLASIAASVTASTNPSRADVSVPNFVIELKDIPEMLHLKGKEHAKRRPSNSAVEGNFGWNLLFQDVRRLINFTDSVNKRVKELKSLHSGNGLKRRRQISSVSYSQVIPNVPIHSGEANISADVTGVTHDLVWATVRWKPDSPAMPSDDDLVHQARLAVHGWDGSSSGLASIAWEAIPWSWFADYFGNLGDVLASGKNAVGASPEPCFIMRTISTTWSLVNVQVSDPSFTVNVGRSVSVFEDKCRQQSLALLSASMAFLGPKQLTTLSSIAYNSITPLPIHG